jgi:ubiquinone biosynthesis protein
VHLEIDLSPVEWLLAVVFVLAVGIVSGRILGVSRGFVRATVAGVLGTLVGLATAAVVLRDEAAPDSAELLVLTFAFGLIATMVLSIALEVVLRRRRPVRRPKLRTRVRTAATIGSRLIEVTRIARRHGLAGPRLASRSAFATPETAARVASFLEDCGGMFVKFGQIASTRADLLPPALVTSLKDLQSDVKPIPVAAVHATLERELGRPAEKAFASFSEEPLAAASIGQTHVARTLDGQDVVVKVRRPDVEVRVTRDAAVLRWASRIADRRSEAARALGLVRVSDELVRSIHKELDYTDEAAYGRALRLATLEANVEGVAVPQVLTSMTSEAVLVLERVRGRPVSDGAAVDACGVARSVLAHRLLRVFLSAMFHSGTFHADPHPGNILVDADGTLWLIDFGAIGIIDAVTLRALQLVAVGLGTGEPGLVARGLREMSGAAGPAIDVVALESEVSRLLSEQLVGAGFDPRTLQDLLVIMERQGLPVPQAFTLIARAVVTLEGTLRGIDPTISIAAVAMKHFGSSLQPAEGDASELARRELLRALPSLRALPALVEDIALQLRSGLVRVEVETLTPARRTALTGWVDQVLFAAVGSVGLLTSALLLVGAGLAGVGTDTATLTAIGSIGLVLSSVMLLRVVAQVVRRQSDAAETLTGR